MKLLHVMRRNLIQVHPIWTNLCKSNKNQNMGSLPKTKFFSKKTIGFFHWTYNFLGSLEAPGNYICIYISISIFFRNMSEMNRHDPFPTVPSVPTVPRVSDGDGLRIQLLQVLCHL